MDALKQQLLKVQQQLTGLSASQKMLTASLLVIMVMTLFYWSNVAGRSDMVPVTGSTLNGTDLMALQNAVQGKGIRYEVRDGKVFVPAGKLSDVEGVMSQLAFDGKLAPAALNKVEEESDASMAFASESVRQAKLQDRHRKRVENMIGQWPGVRSVQVILAGERQTGIMHDSTPTASVSIETRDEGAANKKIAASAQKLVLGAQPGMKAEDIRIVVNGVSFDDDSSNPYSNSDAQLSTRRSNEEYLQKKLLAQLPIAGLRVNVVAKLNTSAVKTEKHVVDPKNVVTAIKQEWKNEESKPTLQTSSEPGVTANTGLETPQSGSVEAPVATSSTSSKTNHVDSGYTNEQTTTLGGDVSAATAAVSVPESYFRRIWKRDNADAKREPKPDEVRLVMAEVIPNLRRQAMRAVNITEEKLVDVSPYIDFEPTLVADASAGAGLAALPTGSGFGAKEIAVAALAVISLFMVAMMVRKTNPQPVLAAAAMGPASATESIPEGNPMLTVGDVIGEVSEGGLTMAGHELSPEAIEAEQVIHQVGTMVKANPDIAANLVKRWLNQD